VDGRMDNPAGCPRDHPQAVGCPQAPQGSTTTIEERQERNTKALQLAQASTLNASSQRRSPTRQNQPHPYNIPRATQPSTEIGHVPEITGHLRRNTQRAIQEPNRQDAVAMLARGDHFPFLLSQVPISGEDQMLLRQLHLTRAPKAGSANCQPYSDKGKYGPHSTNHSVNARSQSRPDVTGGRATDRSWPGHGQVMADLRSSTFRFLLRLAFRGPDRQGDLG
jgi:hypothetical protein